MSMSYTMWVGDVWIQVEDGVKRREKPKRNGIARSWHPNGELADEYELKNGLIVGVRREWHDNGALAKTTPFESGHVHGIVRQWSREGKLLGEYTMTHGRGVKRVWNDDGTVQLEHEQISQSAARGKVYDDRGKAREVFLWNGKPVSKKKFMERLSREQERQT
jgi:hypothetical protein